MAKEAYYFSHDSNASQDPKIIQMCSVYKAEGYGWYWMLIEMMREQEDFKLPIRGKYAINALALHLYADALIFAQFIDDCVNEFYLFERDEYNLWSDSLIRRMSLREEKKEKAKKAAQVRWGKNAETSTFPKNEKCERNADASKSDAIKRKGKERKGKEKESKVKENKDILHGAKTPVPENGKTFIKLSLNDGSEYQVKESQVEEWTELYQAVNIKQELRKMRGWLDANPHRRKTSRGILRFITNWLSKEQDQGGSLRRDGPETGNPFLEYVKEHEDG